MQSQITSSMHVCLYSDVLGILVMQSPKTQGFCVSDFAKQFEKE